MHFEVMISAAIAGGLAAVPAFARPAIRVYPPPLIDIGWDWRQN